MGRQIITLYSSFGIEGYGLCIALAAGIAYALLVRDKQRKQLIDDNRLVQLFNLLILLGISGGRLLFVLTNIQTMSSWLDPFRIWDGGFSLLGSQIGIFLGLAYYCKSSRIPFLKLTDLITFYAPLMIAISRIGCFWSGCCFGVPSQLPFAYAYSDPSCLAPLHIPLHPTQLYHSGILFVIFILLATLRIKYTEKIKPGIITGLSFCLMGFERYAVDFFRGDRELISFFAYSLSIHQILSLAIIVFSISLLISIIFNTSHTVNAYE